MSAEAVLLMVLFSFAKLLYCTEYYVKQDPSSTCPTDAEPCLTLSEYLQNSTMYFTSESTFTLLQGQHHLNQTLTLSGVTGITFRGEEKGTVIIVIDRGGTIMWKNTKECKINLIRIQRSGRSKALLLENSCTLQILNVQFNGGALKFSQAIRVVNSTASFVNCSFTNWYSRGNGGAVYVNASNVTFFGSNNFTSNKAHYFGGAICIVNASNVTFSGINTFINNTAIHGGGLYITNTSHIAFNGSCTFKSNQAISEGGAVFVRQSKLILLSNKQQASIVFESNTAKISGGAIAAVGACIYYKGNIEFFMNLANDNGGGLQIVDSAMRGSGNTIFKKNQADQNGGGVYALSSTISIEGNYSLLENMAKNGGGMALSKRQSSTAIVLVYPVTMSFKENRAKSKGGGLMLIDKLNSCDEDIFFRIETDRQFQLRNIHLNFEQNSAGQAGSVLYGGSVKSLITVNNRTKLTLSEILHISNSTNAIVPKFSSDPVKVCFCNVDHNDCSKSNGRTIYANPGIHFDMSVVALGLGDVAVPATIEASILTGYASTTIYPLSHSIQARCTNITFLLLTEDATNATIALDSGGSCFSNYKSHVILECPSGFTLSSSRCKCSEKRLIEAKVIECVDSDTLQIERQGNSWIDIVNDSMSYSNLSFIYHPECPLNYCRPETERILLHFTDYDSNILCSSNRNGTLCGTCTDGYSLTLYSYNCKKCDNHYLSLLLFFAFAGVALIAVLLALHMTVAAGTINGLILYANIANVNSFIFFPPQSSNKFTDFLSVFISWLNLDLGIETCFYDRLNFYIYAWLEYVFPLYLWFLIGAIIISSRISAKVRMLFGSNPVAVLATVILMSYTKLFQATIVSLTPTFLEYSDGHREKVWLYDGNISYFGGQHFVLGLAALCTVVFLLLPYTFLLLLSYRLQAFSNKRAFSWLNKIKPLLDAYYAPYRAKTRYWPGFMLLVRGCLYITFSVTTLSNAGANLIAVSSVFTALALIPWLGHRVYKKLYNDILEASFILNICVLSTATYYVNASEIKDANQEIATSLSISIAFLQFLGIVCFHLYLRLKDTKLFSFFRSTLVKKSLLHSKESEEQQKQSAVQEVTMTVMDLREPLLESQQQ